MEKARRLFTAGLGWGRALVSVRYVRGMVSERAFRGVKDGEKMYRVGGPIADSGVVVQRFRPHKWKAKMSAWLVGDGGGFA